MTELGRIERPEAEQYRSGRKLYLVPLFYSPQEPPAEYVALLERYWSGVREHLNRIEERIGFARYIFHEGVPVGGDDGLKTIEQLNPRSFELISQKVAGGATVEALEDTDLLVDAIDWQRCVMIGLSSPRVAQRLWEHYRETNKKRNEHIARRVDQTLGDGESGLIILTEEHQVQFHSSIQVFYIAPPTLDEIHRFIRDLSRSRSGSAPAAEVTANDAPEGPETE